VSERVNSSKISKFIVFNLTIDAFRSVIQPIFCKCVTCVAVSGVNPHQIVCFGISTQRSSFITWDRETGKPFHNFITWKDVRADSLVQQWNKSLTMKVCFSEFCLQDLLFGICCIIIGELYLLQNYLNTVHLIGTTYNQ